MSAMMWLRAYNHDFGLFVTSSTLQGLIRVFRIRFCFTCVLRHAIS